MSIFKEDFLIESEELDSSLEYKLKKLSLDEDDMFRLSNMDCESICLTKIGKPLCKSINIKDLKGYARSDIDEDNWLGGLKSLRKMYIFERFGGFESFNEVLNGKNNVDGLPEVTEHKGEYYISGDGRHRLTIAKCIGIDTAKVIAYKGILSKLE